VLTVLRDKGGGLGPYSIRGLGGWVGERREKI